MATLLVSHGQYFCGECMTPVIFEPLNLADGTAIGTCENFKCERRGLRLKVKLQTIEVEELHDA